MLYCSLIRLILCPTQSAPRSLLFALYGVSFLLASSAATKRDTCHLCIGQPPRSSKTSLSKAKISFAPASPCFHTQRFLVFHKNRLRISAPSLSLLSFLGLRSLRLIRSYTYALEFFITSFTSLLTYSLVKDHSPYSSLLHLCFRCPWTFTTKLLKPIPRLACFVGGPGKTRTSDPTLIKRVL